MICHVYFVFVTLTFNFAAPRAGAVVARWLSEQTGEFYRAQGLALPRLVSVLRLVVCCFIGDFILLSLPFVASLSPCATYIGAVLSSSGCFQQNKKAHTHTHTRAHTYIYAQAYIHTYIHTHTQIYTHT